MMSNASLASKQYVVKLEEVIQGCGALLVVNENALKILAASENVVELIDKIGSNRQVERAESVIGQPLSDIITEKAYACITQLLQRTHGLSSNSCQLPTDLPGRTQYFVSATHIEAGILLSIEEDESDAAGDGYVVPLIPVHQLARKAIDRLQLAPVRNISWICDVAVQELHALTGYERVFMARVVDSEHAEIVAERCNEGFEQWMGKHIPAPDSWVEWLEGGQLHVPLRMVYDIWGQQAAVLKDASVAHPIAVALSPLAGLGEGQRNLAGSLGVRSLLIMPLVVMLGSRRRLWGLVFFHSYSAPHKVPCSRRAACSFVMQALQTHLLTALRAEERADERQIVAMQSTICERLTYQVPAAIVTEQPAIDALVPCDGIAHIHGSTMTYSGLCPSTAQVERLLKWIRAKAQSSMAMFVATCLKDEGFEEELERGLCGVVVTPISELDTLLWFRKKAYSTLVWAWKLPKVHSMAPLHTRATLWTSAEKDAIQGLQQMAIETLRGNSEPMKTMILVRLNEERLKAMQDLAIVARDLGRMIDIAKTPVLGLSKDILVTEWNQQMAELTGRPKETVLGHALDDVLLKESVEAVLEKVALVLQGHTQEHAELSLRCAGKVRTAAPDGLGGVVVLMATMAPQWDAENEVIGVSVVGQDITEQKRTMQQCEAEAADDEYSNILEQASMPVWAVARDGTIHEWNAAMSRTTGIPREHALGKLLVGDLIGAEKVLVVPERETLLALDFAIQRALAGHETPLSSFNFMNSEGRAVNSVIRMQKRNASSGQVLCFMQDVTMRRATEKAMMVRLAAEAAADARSRHLAFLCHEIRNPLNGILGNITFMEDTTLTEEQKELVETTATCGYQLRKIVQDVLDMSDIAGGKVQLEHKELQLSGIVNAVVMQVGIAATKKGLQLYSSVEPRCKEFCPLGDAPRLQQILSNFAWNAVKFTHQGWVEISVGMQEPAPPDPSGRRSAHYTFRVSDTGEGLPENLRKRLFEQFATGRKSSTSQYGGTGLGLSISLQLASMMGGEVRCHSQVGKGSIFSLEVDLEVLPAAAHHLSISGHPEPEPVDNPVAREPPRKTPVRSHAHLPSGEAVNGRNTSGGARLGERSLPSIAAGPFTVPLTRDEVETAVTDRSVSLSGGLQSSQPHVKLPKRKPLMDGRPKSYRRDLQARLHYDETQHATSSGRSRQKFSPAALPPEPVGPKGARSSAGTPPPGAELQQPPGLATVRDGLPVAPSQTHATKIKSASSWIWGVEPSSFAAANAKVAGLVTQSYGNGWSFRVLREMVSPEFVSVLGEVSLDAVCTRQAWGSVPCTQGAAPGLLLPAATAAAFSEAAALLPQLGSGSCSLPTPSPANGNLDLSTPQGFPPQTPRLMSSSSLPNPRSSAPFKQPSPEPARIIAAAVPSGPVRSVSQAAADCHNPKGAPHSDSPLASADGPDNFHSSLSSVLAAHSKLESSRNPLANRMQGLDATTSPGTYFGNEQLPPVAPLPVPEPAPGRLHLSGSFPRKENVGSSKSGPTVLIVDDEPVNVRVVKRALDRANFNVETGADGLDVVARVVEQGQRFDALLLDERLKVMNGSEACTRVRVHERAQGLEEMPIIAISANVEPDDLVRYAKAGYSAVMGKPINVRTVGDRMRQFITSYSPLLPSRRAELDRGDPVRILKHIEDIRLFS